MLDNQASHALTLSSTSHFPLGCGGRIGSEGVCSARRWVSLILMLEMDWVTSVPKTAFVEAMYIDKGDQRILTRIIVEGHFNFILLKRGLHAE